MKSQDIVVASGFMPCWGQVDYCLHHVINRQRTAISCFGPTQSQLLTDHRHLFQSFLLVRESDMIKSMPQRYFRGPKSESYRSTPSPTCPSYVRQTHIHRHCAKFASRERLDGSDAELWARGSTVNDRARSKSIPSSTVIVGAKAHRD